MNRKLTATLLIAAAVLTNAAFTVLGTVFNYPDVLGEPVEDILAAFRANQTTVVAWFAVMALSAALFAPIAIGVGRLSTHRAMRIAVPVGIAAAVVQVIGLARWPVLVPGFAADAASSDPTIAAGARDSFLLAHRVLGTVVGETLGYLLTAAWTAAGPGRSAPWDAPLVHRTRSGFRGPHPQRHAEPAPPARRGHRQLHRLRHVERLAGDLRDTHPSSPPPLPRCSARAGAVGRQEGGDIMTASASRLDTFWWSWLIWTAGFLAFPIAGVAGRTVAGRVDSPVAALVAGLVTGAVIGAGQWLASRRRLRPARWILATALGMGLGLLLGATVVGFRTSLADLALMGALTGVVLGVAQTLALPAQTRRRWWWAVAMPLLWALGWTITTLAGIPVEQQFTIFGASGAVTFSALSGLLLHRLLPVRSVTSTGPARVDARVVSKL